MQQFLPRRPLYVLQPVTKAIDALTLVDLVHKFHRKKKKNCRKKSKEKKSKERLVRPIDSRNLDQFRNHCSIFVCFRITDMMYFPSTFATTTTNGAMSAENMEPRRRSKTIHEEVITHMKQHQQLLLPINCHLNCSNTFKRHGFSKVF